MEIIMNNNKEKIAKNIMWIFIVSIVLIGIYLFSKGQWINGIICSILAFCYSPFFLDKIAEKIGFVNDYCYIVRFIVTILFVFLILFILIVFINIMTNYGVSGEVISSRSMAICKCLAYLGYFAIIFLYKDTNKTRKYFVFGITYILCTLISYIPNTDYNFIIKILNYLPSVKKLDQESYLLIIDGILMPIKEAFLTYIIFDTVISEKDAKRENAGESKENSEIVKNKSIFKKKSRRLDEKYYNFYTYEDYALVGTKGYCYEGKDSYEHFLKIRERELGRLRCSFEGAKAAGYEKFIMFLHYPPTSIGEMESPFTLMAQEFGAEKVIYSHCHGEKRYDDSFKGYVDGIEYKLVSGDYLDFKPEPVLR